MFDENVCINLYYVNACRIFFFWLFIFIFYTRVVYEKSNIIKSRCVYLYDLSSVLCMHLSNMTHAFVAQQILMSH